MFCPQCKAEYRPGFSRCADCDADLVEDWSIKHESNEQQGTAQELSSLPEGEKLQSIWEGENGQDCAAVCGRLRSAGIPYKVNQIVVSHAPRMNVDWKFQICVQPSDLEEAKNIANYNVLDFTDSEEDQAITELPAHEDRPVESVRGDWNPPNWFPEDATAEVWQGGPGDSGWMLEMAFKENRINYRVDLESDDLKRLFVMPEDEARAREIVREIVEGTPPK